MPTHPRKRAAAAAPKPVAAAPAPVPAEPAKSWLPTKKWIVAQVTAVGTWLIAAIQAGWDIGPSLQIVAVGIVVQAIATWVMPNDATPGGVPLKK